MNDHPGQSRRTAQPPGTHHSDGRLVLVIPAHDEEDDLPDALRSVERQSRAPDRTIVVADNCSDCTESIAKSVGWCEVWCSEGNTAKKAGALNQAWTRLDPDLRDHDHLLVMDADTELDPEFAANALCHFDRRKDDRLGGIGARFYGKPGSGAIGALQRMEYARFARSISRKRGRTFVLSGTATMFHVGTLRRLIAERGYLYDATSMLEDYELSLALRTRGYQTLAPRDVRVRTEVMESVGRLWRQRIRWQRGTIEELRRYGFNRVTSLDVGRQLLLAASALSRFLLVAVVLVSLLWLGGLSLQWGWMALACVIAAERAISVRSLGFRYSAFALLLVPEELYAVFRETFFVRSAWLALTSSEWEWHAT